MVSAVILWKGAGEVLDGSFTVGMLVAYLSYQMRFSSSISSLTDKFFAWRTLDVYNERLADIVLTSTEGHQQQPVQEDNNKFHAAKITYKVITREITSSHTATLLNYRRAVSGRSNFLAYNNFPEVYHGQEVSEARFFAAARRVTGQGMGTTYSVIFCCKNRYILC